MEQSSQTQFDDHVELFVVTGGSTVGGELFEPITNGCMFADQVEVVKRLGEIIAVEPTRPDLFASRGDSLFILFAEFV